MGFYAPDSLVHGAGTAGGSLPRCCIDSTVNASEVECTVQDGGVRLGLGYIKDVTGAEMRELVAERERNGPFRSLGELAGRIGAGRRALEQLAWSGACDQITTGSVGERSATAHRSEIGQRRPTDRRSASGPVEIGQRPVALADLRSVGETGRRSALWQLGIAAPGLGAGEDTSSRCRWSCRRLRACARSGAGSG